MNDNIEHDSEIISADGACKIGVNFTQFRIDILRSIMTDSKWVPVVNEFFFTTLAPISPRVKAINSDGTCLVLGVIGFNSPTATGLKTELHVYNFTDNCVNVTKIDPLIDAVQITQIAINDNDNSLVVAFVSRNGEQSIYEYSQSYGPWQGTCILEFPYLADIRFKLSLDGTLLTTLVPAAGGNLEEVTYARLGNEWRAPARTD